MARAARNCSEVAIFYCPLSDTVLCPYSDNTTTGEYDNDQYNPKPGHDTGLPITHGNSRLLSDLAHEACKLAAMLEGLDVLIDQASGMDHDPLAKMARNSLPPMIETLIQKAWALNQAIEHADHGRRHLRPAVEGLGDVARQA